MAADHPAQQGLVRPVNRSERVGTLRIHAIDDSGRRFGPLFLEMAANAASHFNSMDLEAGNADKGLAGGVGDGEGKWQLFVSADRPLQVMSLLQSPTGHLSNLSR